MTFLPVIFPKLLMQALIDSNFPATSMTSLKDISYMIKKTEKRKSLTTSLSESDLFVYAYQVAQLKCLQESTRCVCIKKFWVLEYSKHFYVGKSQIYVSTGQHLHWHSAFAEIEWLYSISNTTYK